MPISKRRKKPAKAAYIFRRRSVSLVAVFRATYSPALRRILSGQRLLSGMSAEFTGGFGRPGRGVGGALALERFVNPPKVGRPKKSVVMDRYQLKFNL